MIIKPPIKFTFFLNAWLIFVLSSSAYGVNEKDLSVQDLEGTLSFRVLNNEGKAEKLTQLIEVHIEDRDYPNALSYALKYEQYAKTIKDTKILAEAYSLKGKVLIALDKINSALESCNAALVHYRKLHDSVNIRSTLITLGKLYPRVLEKKIALELLQEAAQIPAHDAKDQSRLYTALSTVYNELGKVDSSHFFAEKALLLDKIENDTLFIIYDYVIRSGIYLSSNQYQKVILQLDSARQYNWDKLPDITIETIYNNYFIAYLKLGYMESALDSYGKYIAFHDHAYNEKLNNEIKELEYLHENEKILIRKNQSTQLKSAYQQSAILLLVIIILLLILVAFLFLSKKRKSENLQLKIEQKLLNVQMNPHFIFNTLAIIQSHVESGEKKIAGKYLNHFAKLIRATLEHSREDFITIQDEVHILEQYLFLQQMRFNNEFDYEIRLENIQSDTEVMIPPMIIQPFVENAIQHGIRGLDRKGEITVTLSIDGEQLKCVISDNGRGLQSVKPNPNKKSLATQIVRERLHILSTQFKQKTTIIVTDRFNKNEKGVEVVLTIPLLDH